MTLPSAKEIAKLATACRKAGISTFKGGGIEFTLTDTMPPSKQSKKQLQASPSSSNDTIETDEPGYEALLHWSVTPRDDEEEDRTEQ